MIKPQTVDDYIAALPEPAKARAQELRTLILHAAPEAKETLSYGMPYYSYHGRLVYWGAFTSHLGLYVMSAAREALAAEIEPYRQSKATLHFALTKPLPADLITLIVTTQYAANAQSRST